MMVDNRIYHSQVLIPGNKITNQRVANSKKNVGDNPTPFTQVLAQTIEGVKFSQHALQRLETRNIKLGPSDLLKLNDAVDKAAQKGAKESLVFMSNQDLALVVSVKNKTVITAMDRASGQDNIFTNIDSAVIV
jgi:flagellar operon protein